MTASGVLFEREHERMREQSYGDPLDLDHQTLGIAPSPKITSPVASTPYGTIANGDKKPPSPEDPDFNPKEAKKMEDALRKMEKKGEKRTLKGTARAVALVTKLSPKSQRKKDKLLNTTAHLKTEGSSMSGYIKKSFLFGEHLDDLEQAHKDAIPHMQVTLP